jgi:hypothetical protein
MAFWDAWETWAKMTFVSAHAAAIDLELTLPEDPRLFYCKLHLNVTSRIHAH